MQSLLQGVLFVPVFLNIAIELLPTFTAHTHFVSNKKKLIHISFTSSEVLQFINSKISTH